MIIRGTTPTIKFTFNVVDPANIAAAYLTITGQTVTEKDISSMTVGEDFVSWDFTQEETLAFTPGKEVAIQLRYRTTDGKAYATRRIRETVIDVDKEGVI